MQNLEEFQRVLMTYRPSSKTMSSQYEELLAHTISAGRTSMGIKWSHVYLVDDYSEYKGHMYFIGPDNVNFYSAAAYCQSFLPDSYPALPNDENELDFLTRWVPIIVLTMIINIVNLALHHLCWLWWQVSYGAQLSIKSLEPW